MQTKLLKLFQQLKIVSCFNNTLQPAAESVPTLIIYPLFFLDEIKSNPAVCAEQIQLSIDAAAFQVSEAELSEVTDMR